MDFKQFSRVFRRFFIIQAKQRFQWRASLAFDVISTAVWMGVYAMFWRVIFDRFPGFQGWSFPSILAFVAFQELSYGLLTGLFIGATKFWIHIKMGWLDNYLTKPFDPRLMAVVSRINPWQVAKSALMFTILLVLASRMGLNVDIIRVTVAVLLAFLGAVGRAMITMTINFVAFWWGDVDALHELIGTMDHFGSFPTTVFPTTIQIVFTLGFPLIFAATFPALFTAAKVALLDLAAPLLMLLIGLFIWATVLRVLWASGLRRYESYGG